MPALPWAPGPARDAQGDSVVMASHFRVRSYWQVIPFLIDAMRVHALARRSAGAIGVALDAQPLRKEFWTLSQWRDRASLDAMVRAEPHASVMARQRKVMAQSAFRFWTAPATEPPTWDDARARILQ